MSIFLTTEEIAFHASEIRADFEKIIFHRWFSARQKALQWQFFNHCFKVLMREESGDFTCSKLQSAQYKYEITTRLNRYYLSGGAPIRFIFSLVHENHDGLAGYEEATYPGCNGYLLRVSPNDAAPEALRLKRLLAEKVVTEAAKAEFDVLSSLPDLDLSPLDNLFDKNGSAYKRIVHIANGTHRRGWTLQNPENPSVVRSIDVKVENLTTKEARLRTAELWQLYWWSPETQTYAHQYNEVNRQIYTLKWNNDRWLVHDNVYPKPKTSTPRRNIQSSKKKSE